MRKSPIILGIFLSGQATGRRVLRKMGSFRATVIQKHFRYSSMNRCLSRTAMTAFAVCLYLLTGPALAWNPRDT
jgi:hypothetical protein